MKRYVTVISLLLIFLSACSRSEIIGLTEPVKSINGTWKISQATRNGTDLTNSFNFSHFSIKFTDSTYTIDSLVPFAVEGSGSYHFDDPQYPFKILFMQQDSTMKEFNLQFPIVNGVRNIVLTFSPGCTSNSYQYTLQKTN
ncbi:DUF5004 domain-containing protein [Arachidicoccus sp.]|jgi:hypothetical protein|uniref:DUF5004 domain-containing protein n=1 Tax=Arachidicoccus sp. TaxID=1872624 RepID=UPI003D1AD62B